MMPLFQRPPPRLKLREKGLVVGHSLKLALSNVRPYPYPTLFFHLGIQLRALLIIQDGQAIGQPLRR